jgi:hypothetical protein
VLSFPASELPRDIAVIPRGSESSPQQRGEPIGRLPPHVGMHMRVVGERDGCFGVSQAPPDTTFAGTPSLSSRVTWAWRRCIRITGSCSSSSTMRAPVAARRSGRDRPADDRVVLPSLVLADGKLTAGGGSADAAPPCRSWWLP